MSIDILSIVPFAESMKPQALEYLRKSISPQTAHGVTQFVSKQSQLFNEYAPDLAEILRIIDNAPTGINLNQFQDWFVQWLRENGVSSSRITHLKGYMRLRQRALGPNSRYKEEEKKLIASLEVEKAYLFGRLTFEGQAKALLIFKEDQKLALRDLRELVKTDAYDPSNKWKENYEGKNHGNPFEEFDMTKPPHSKSEDLAVKLHETMHQFMSLRGHWERDRRVLNILDYNQIDAIHNTMKSFNDPYCSDFDYEIDGLSLPF